MDYKLVFVSNIESVNLILNWYISSFILGIILIAIYIINAHKTIKIFLSILILAGLFGKYRDYKVWGKAQNDVKMKSYLVIEGKIEKFNPMHKSGHGVEEFDINGTHFEIGYTGDYPKTKTMFYTLTKNRNGPIYKNGQEVKVHYVHDNSEWCTLFFSKCGEINNGNENKIVKLWVKTP